jgi:hypothetical protein
MQLPAGTPAQIRAEIDRLTARLEMLKSRDATIAAIKPDANLDPEGHRLSVMLQWRNQRVAAIEAEIPRLQQQALRLAKWDSVWRSDADATDAQGAAASKFDSVNKELIRWLEDNGAQVMWQFVWVSEWGGGGASTKGQRKAQGGSGRASGCAPDICCNHSICTCAMKLESSMPDNEGFCTSCDANLQVNVELQLVASQQQACTSNDRSTNQATCAAAKNTERTGAGAPAAGVFTRRDVKQGDTMAVIPAELGYTVKSGSQKLVSVPHIKCFAGLCRADSTLKWHATKITAALLAVILLLWMC